jgi:peptide/nickel transport system permease protein
MLASDLGYLSQQPWAPLVPGVAIMITVGALNLLADAIRDVSAPGGLPGARRRRASRRTAVAPPAPPRPVVLPTPAVDDEPGSSPVREQEANSHVRTG